ncbi:hypothetical protein EDD37DRAFT_119014 [Exophiala viscosa]|uniref:Uncharacterized protein n=1 Tax=Exophiala viscosa TaxID=2486360 RepID=A0AAN6DXI9_9EURO|nr:hypothetical protein EDD36DRAFT_226485 [Exophiala viscosa]KAI1621476.1 hypothetical protein EDD37DRAFT_119014 [Exophiala viscosa]
MMSTKLSPEIDRSSTPPQTRSTDLSENRDYFDSDRRGGKYHGSFKDRDTESSRRNEYLIELRNAFEDLRTKFATLDEIHFQKGAEARSHNKKSRSKKQNLLLKPDGYGTPPIVDRQILDFNFIYHEEARTIFMGRLANNLEVWTSISQDSPNPLRYLLGNQGGSKVRETELALVDDSAYPMHAIMEELSLRRDCQYEEVRVLDLETVLLAALCCFQAGWEAGQKSALALWVCEFIQHVLANTWRNPALPPPLPLLSPPWTPLMQ